MHAFLVRSAVILALLFSGAFLAGLTGRHFLAISVWFVAVSVWTLTLGFRRALLIIIPFLLLLDTLWDGTVGSLFLFGFFLATLVTYIVVRIEEQAALLQNVIYSVLTSFLATLATLDLFWWQKTNIILTEPQEVLKIFLWFLGIILILFSVEKKLLTRVERWLDASYREQLQKIR